MASMPTDKSATVAQNDVPGAAKVASPVDRRASWSTLLRWLLTFVLGAVVLSAIFIDTLTTGAGLPFVLQRGQTFVTIFLGIFIEAVSFLLLGSLVSGFIAVFVSQDMLDRRLPHQPLLATLAGAGMGLLFPVCECGVVPVARRLFEKGLPLSAGIAFLLAAPVINPIVIFSTYVAFGFGPVLWGRIVFTFLIAVTVGLVFALAKPSAVLLPAVCDLRDQGGVQRSCRVRTAPAALSASHLHGR